MRFTVLVGNNKKAELEVSYNNFFGLIRIRVDKKTVIRQLRSLSFALVKRYEFPLDESDGPQIIAVEKERKLLLPFLRKQKFRVFENGVLIAEREGY